MWLEDIPLTISVQNSTVDMDSSDEEFTHDRLVDEDIDYISRYLNATVNQKTIPFDTLAIPELVVWWNNAIIIYYNYV